MARLLRSTGVSKLRPPAAVGASITFSPVRIKLVPLTQQEAQQARKSQYKLRAPVVTGASIVFSPVNTNLAQRRIFVPAVRSKLGRPILAVQIQHLLEAVVNGSSTVVADLTLGKNLEGLVSGSSTVLAVLAPTQRLLDALASGSSTIIVDLALGKPIEAVVNGSSLVFGDLQVTTPAPGTLWVGFPWGAYMLLLRDEEKLWP
jgi:hypothetical protein